jgi:hypothetical protein
MQYYTRWHKYRKALAAYYAIKWKERWEISDKGRDIAIYYPSPTEKALDLYKNRLKPFYSILI